VQLAERYGLAEGGLNSFPSVFFFQLFWKRTFRYNLHWFLWAICLSWQSPSQQYQNAEENNVNWKQLKIKST